MVEGEKQLLKTDSDQHGWAEVRLYLHTLAVLYYTGREGGREEKGILLVSFFVPSTRRNGWLSVP